MTSSDPSLELKMYDVPVAGVKYDAQDERPFKSQPDPLTRCAFVYPASHGRCGALRSEHPFEHPFVEPDPESVMTASIVVQLEPLRQPGGGTYTGDLDAYAKQLGEYFVHNIRAFADVRDADVFLVIQVERGEEKAGHEYRSGHYVKETPDEPERSEPAD